MLRAVIYGRYSSDLQRETSIEDQIRVCKQRIEQEGWLLGKTYSVRSVVAHQCNGVRCVN